MTDPTPKTIKLEDLAVAAGVSVSTVSRALAGHPAIAQQTRERIRELAEGHGYDAPRRRARTTGRAAPYVKVIMPPPAPGATEAADPFVLSLLGGVGAAMRERRSDFLISHEVPADSLSLASVIDGGQQDGLIFLGQSQLHAGLNLLARQGRRFVVWGASVEDQLYCSIGSDNVKGGLLATNHLIRLGHRRIAFIGQTSVFEILQRRQGFDEALLEAGIAPDERLYRPCRFMPDAAAEAVDDLLDEGLAFDAIVAASDLIAVGAMRALTRRGLRIPNDVAVVGYDDIEIAAHTHPALTTIRQDPVKAGRLLVSKLMRIMAGDRASSERVPTELIVRETCGA